MAYNHSTGTSLHSFLGVLASGEVLKNLEEGLASTNNILSGVDNLESYLDLLLGFGYLSFAMRFLEA